MAMPVEVDNQQQWLQEAFNVVRQQAYSMKRALDGHQLMDALKHASTIVCELRTSRLSPKNYFALYMSVLDELQHLEMYFNDEARKGKPVSELYELVQQSGNVLPRLYLLILVGAVFIRSKEAPAKDVLRDLQEMVKGVQHPLRGLFLRNYLMQLCKDKLPDVNNEYLSGGSTVMDSIDFLISNLTEMNKVWVRMKHQGPLHERDKREAERRDLQLLVGKALNRIADLEGITSEMYARHVLPRILEQIVACKDDIAQQYLLDAIIQAFPDEFHLRTLDEFLGAFAQLETDVDIKATVLGLIKRLIQFASSGENQIPADIDVFGIFEARVSHMVKVRQLPIGVTLGLFSGLMDLALHFGPAEGRLANADRVLAFVASVLGDLGVTKVSGRQNVDSVVQLLSAPHTAFATLDVLMLEHYAGIMPLLDFDTRCKVCRTVAGSVLKRREPLADLDRVARLFNFMAPLVVDEADTPKGDAVDQDMFAEEQGLVARLIQLVKNPAPEVTAKLLEGLRKVLLKGGEARFRCTAPSLLFRLLSQATNVFTQRAENADYASGVSLKKVFGAVHDLSTRLVESAPLLSLPVFLQAAKVAGHCALPEICYEFMTQAFLAYETSYSGSKEQFEGISLIVGALHELTGLSDEEYGTLILKATQYSARLLKKDDQCRAICKCAHLYWHAQDSTLPREGGRVVECLERARKIAKSMVGNAAQCSLYVSMLNEFLYFFANQVEQISETVVNKFAAEVQGIVDASDDKEVQQFLSATMQTVRRQQRE